MNDFVAFNAIYAKFFGEAKPARSTVEVARLPKDALVEIEVRPPPTSLPFLPRFPLFLIGTARWGVEVLTCTSFGRVGNRRLRSPTDCPPSSQSCSFRGEAKRERNHLSCYRFPFSFLDCARAQKSSELHGKNQKPVSSKVFSRAKRAHEFPSRRV